jgi:SAM-dependent methyltransferase
VEGGYDAELFARIAEVEPRSFWFNARNRLIVSCVGLHFPGSQSLLEVGCGTGYVLAALHDAFPQMRLVGTELFEEGLRIARERLPESELVQADARSLDYEDEFDVVGAFDLLEHVVEDEQVLAGLARATRPGGGTILLVPQHPRLWSAMDDVAQHVRRYTRGDLLAKVTRTGLEIVHVSSFVSTLLPAMTGSRMARRVLRRPYDPVDELVPGRLSGLFERMLNFERRLIERGVSLPFGGSLLVISRKP